MFFSNKYILDFNKCSSNLLVRILIHHFCASLIMNVCCHPCFYGKSNRPKITKFNLYKSKGNVNAKSHFKTFLTRNSPFISQINYNLCLNQEELNLQFKNPRSLDLTSFPY